MFTGAVSSSHIYIFLHKNHSISLKTHSHASNAHNPDAQEHSTRHWAMNQHEKNMFHLTWVMSSSSNYPQKCIWSFKFGLHTCTRPSLSLPQWNRKKTTTSFKIINMKGIFHSQEILSRYSIIISMLMHKLWL